MCRENLCKKKQQHVKVETFIIFVNILKFKTLTFYKICKKKLNVKKLSSIKKVKKNIIINAVVKL